MEALLEKLSKSENPSIRFRLLTEVLQYPQNDPEIIELRNSIINSTQVEKIFARMEPEGYWLQTNPRTKRTVGEGVEYGAFATTHYVLSYLSELGLDKNHSLVNKAADRYLSLIEKDGDWWDHMSCLYGLNIRTFIRLGYRNDQRLQKAIELMLNTQRADGGYLCDMHEKKRKYKKKKSCYRGSVKALLAFSELPEHYAHPRCLELIEYFLKRDVIFNSKKTQPVTKDVTTMSYPITWGANTFEALLALSKMGYGSHKSLKPAWDELEKHKGQNGLYILDTTPAQSPFKVGKRGMENEWVSFYVLLAKTLANKNRTNA